MANLAALLFLLAGVNLINIAVSGLLWFEQRTPMHRSFVLIWCFGCVALVTNALFPSGALMAVAAGVPSFCMNLCLADVLRRALGLGAAWRAYGVGFVLAVLTCLVCQALGAPFWLATFPVMAAVGAPLLHVALSASTRWATLSLSARAVIIVAVGIALHELDYPFLRPDPRFAAAGFVIAILIAFALSITAPAVMLGATAAKVQKLEAEVIQAERLAALGEAAAVLAHEVRNPLATIANSIQLLRKESAVSEGARDLLAIQQMEVGRLDRLVQDLLCFTRPLQPRLGAVELSEVIRGATAMLQPRAAEAQVRLEVEPGSSQELRADPDHLHMALSNVLQNAIEASPQGGCVRVNVVSRDGELSLCIDDEGSGVPAELITRVFEPFFTTRAQGSGLGLAITRLIMKAHGGDVRVSNLGRGARFELVFGNPQRS
jgi:signal transduction histidine kinase